MPVLMSLKVCGEMYDLIAKESDSQEIPMIDVVVRALAEHFKRPELGYVPRKLPGRRRRKLPA